MTSEQVAEIVDYLKRIAEALEAQCPKAKATDEHDKDKKHKSPVRTA